MLSSEPGEAMPCNTAAPHTLTEVHDSLYHQMRSIGISMNPPTPQAEQLTDEVPAAASGGASTPGAVELGQNPLGNGVVTQGVRRQVADLQPGVLTQEVRERHPVWGKMSHRCHTAPDGGKRWRGVVGGAAGEVLPELSVLRAVAQMLAVLVADVAPLRGAAAVETPVTTGQEQLIDHHLRLNFTSCFRNWYKDFKTLKQQFSWGGGWSWFHFLGDKASTFLGNILTLLSEAVHGEGRGATGKRTCRSRLPSTPPGPRDSGSGSTAPCPHGSPPAFSHTC